MTRKQPRVSLGMPLYNAEKYLKQAFDSLLGQTFDDFEIVISDNASTDGTEAICRAYMKHEPRIRYQRADKNQGSIWNFNQVFELSRGELFKWAAYDDLLHPTFLEECVSALDADESVMWVHPLTVHIDERGEIIPPESDPTIPDGHDCHTLITRAEGTERRDSVHPHERFANVLLGTTWCSDAYGLYRSHALRKTRMHLAVYGSEKVLSGELSLQGQFAEIPKVLFFERVHGDAATSLATAAEQRALINPNGKNWFPFTRLHLLWGHFTAVLRANLKLAERLKCFGVIARYLLQVSKWRRIARQSATGAGMEADSALNNQGASMLLDDTKPESSEPVLTNSAL